MNWDFDHLSMAAEEKYKDRRYYILCYWDDIQMYAIKNTEKYKICPKNWILA